REPSVRREGDRSDGERRWVRIRGPGRLAGYLEPLWPAEHEGAGEHHRRSVQFAVAGRRRHVRRGAGADELRIRTPRPMTAPIRILAVDDHRVVLEGISAIVGRQPDMVVTGMAITGEQGISLFRQQRPDVTLMDLQLPRMTGLETIQAIRHEDPSARIVVLT